MKGFLILLGANLFLRFPTLLQKVVNIDEPMYAQFAHNLIRGDAPYTTMIGEKPVLLYLYYYVVLGIFGDFNMTALHAVTILWVTLTAFCMLSILKSFVDERMALWGAIVFSMLSTLGDLKMISTDAETLANLPICLASMFLLSGAVSGRLRAFFLAGIFIGVAAHFRYHSAIMLAVAGTFLVIYEPFFSEKRSDLKDALLKGLLQLSITVAGFIVFSSAVVAVLWSMGSLEGYLFWTLRYEMEYIKVGMRTINMLEKGAIRTLFFVAVGFVFWFSAAVTVMRQRRNRLVAFSLIWFLWSFAAVSVGGRFATRYFTQIYPPLAILAVLSLPPAWNALKKWKAAAILIPVLVLWVMRLFSTPIYEAFGELDYARLNERVGRYIEERTKKDDMIYVWGWGNAIYIHAGRHAATRFINADFLTGRIPGSKTVKDPSFDTSFNVVPGSWDWFMSDLERDRPVYIVDTSPANVHDYGKYPVSAYPRLQEFLNRNYSIETVMDGLRLYRLKGS